MLEQNNVVKYEVIEPSEVLALNNIILEHIQKYKPTSYNKVYNHKLKEYEILYNEVPYDTDTYLNVFNDLINNIVNRDYKNKQEFITTYKALISNFNVVLNSKTANALFDKYITSATIDATSGKSGMAVTTYEKLFNELNNINENVKVKTKGIA